LVRGSKLKVLVAGGAGFIGSHLVDLLLANGYKVTVADDFSKGELRNIQHDLNNPNMELLNCDLRRIDDSRQAIKGIDTVFLLAASIGGIGFFHKHQARILDTNALLTSSIFNAIVEEGAKRIIFVSSSMVFERTDVFPTPEDALEVTPAPATSYGFSKLIGEYYCKAYLEEHGIKYTIIRPFNCYGPREAPGKEVGESHVIPDLALKIITGSHPLEILGSGDQTRSFTYVADVVEAMKLALEKKEAENEDFNIGSQEETSIKKLAETLWKICGRKEPLKLKHLPSFKFDVQRRIPDVQKAKEKLGWYAKTELREGLEKTVQWVRTHLHEV
jgi:nucleoside-diphosphate-sugar epimerase